MDRVDGIMALVALLVSLLVTWWLVKKSGQLGLDRDRDLHRKFERAPVSRLGGLALVVSYGVIFAILGVWRPETWGGWWTVVLTCVGYFALGLIDDLHPIGAKRKLIGQVVLAIAAYALGLRIEIITSPAGDASWSLGGASLAVTVVWLVAIPNIINLIDGMDGLATGLGIFVVSTLSVVLFASHQDVAALFCLAMAAALLGFLLFNFPPAKIYLGDGGAYFVGAFIATHSMMGSQKGSVAAMFFVVLIALGLPILDTAVAILRRGFIGLPVFHADAHHVHHYLQRSGASKRRVLVILYGCCLVFCGIGLTIFWSQGVILPSVFMAVFLAMVIGANRLALFEQLAKVRAKGYQVLKRRHAIRRAHASANYLMHELEHCETLDEFSRIFESAAARLGFVTERERFLADHSENGDQTDQTDQTEEAFLPVEIANPGNPRLRLYVPSETRGHQNWRLVGHCLYPPFAAAQHRFGKERNRF